MILIDTNICEGTASLPDGGDDESTVGGEAPLEDQAKSQQTAQTQIHNATPEANGDPP